MPFPQKKPDDMPPLPPARPPSAEGTYAEPTARLVEVQLAARDPGWLMSNPAIRQKAKLPRGQKMSIEDQARFGRYLIGEDRVGKNGKLVEEAQLCIHARSISGCLKQAGSGLCLAMVLRG